MSDQRQATKTVRHGSMTEKTHLGYLCEKGHFSFTWDDDYGCCGSHYIGSLVVEFDEGRTWDSRNKEALEWLKDVTK